MNHATPLDRPHCRRVRLRLTHSDAPGSRYLYVWAGDRDEKDSDFLAVIDVRPASSTYGQVLGTVPVGMTGTLPHHMEYQLPDSSRWLFVNGHYHEQIFLFDTRDAEHPSLVKALSPPAPFRYPHDMVRLPGGNLLIGYLRSEGPSPLKGDSTTPGGSGGIAELTPEGAVVRSVRAADSAFAVPIRPYSFAMRPEIDRMLMTSALMMEDTSADVIQISQSVLESSGAPQQKRDSFYESECQGHTRSSLIARGAFL